MLSLANHGLLKQPQFCTPYNYKENAMTKTLSLKDERPVLRYCRQGRPSLGTICRDEERDSKAVVMGADEFESWVEHPGHLVITFGVESLSGKNHNRHFLTNG